MPWGSQEYPVGTYEVLIGDSSFLQWICIGTQAVAAEVQIERPPSPLLLEPLALPTALPSLKAPRTIESEDIRDDSSRTQFKLSRPFFAMEGGFEPSHKAVVQSFKPFPLTPPLSPIFGRFNNWFSAPSLVTLFVSQAYYEGGWHAGKVEAGDDHCCIGWGGGEVWVKDFRVLAWAL